MGEWTDLLFQILEDWESYKNYPDLDLFLERMEANIEDIESFIATSEVQDTRLKRR